MHKQKFPAVRALRIIGSGTLLLVLLAAAKIWAVASFMQRFPREADYAHPATHWIEALASVPTQILLPSPLRFLDRAGLLSAESVFHRWAGTGVDDLGLSPIALGLVPWGVYLWMRAWRGEQLLLRTLALLGAVWLTLEVTLGRGLLWPW